MSGLGSTLRKHLRVVILLRPAWKGLARVFLLASLGPLLGLLAPVITKTLVDTALPAKNLTLAQTLLVAALVLAIGDACLTALRTQATGVIAADLSARMSLLLFDHIQRQPLRFFDRRRVGEVNSRFVDIRQSLASVSQIWSAVAVNGLQLVLVPPILLYLDAKLALLFLATIPITSAVSWLWMRSTQPLMRKQAESAADVSAIQFEVFANIRTYKSFGLERIAYQQATAAHASSVHYQREVLLRGQLFGVLMSSIAAAGTLAYSVYGWRHILSGGLTLGEFLAFTAYAGFVARPIAFFGSLATSIQHSAVSMDRAFEYLDCEAEWTDARIAAPLSRTQLPCSIEMRGVAFGYEASSRELKDVTVRCQPGSLTAIVGHTGAGKSTLARLFGRYDSPSEGQVLLDEMPAELVPLPAYRERVLVVWQDALPVRGTLRFNLCPGSSAISEERIHRALVASGLDEFVQRLPSGLDTEIGELGATISTGQRQRLSIARALLKNADVYVFDEVFSGLDVQTEGEVLRGILDVLRGRTLIIVTHRLGWLHLAQQVCFFSQGRLVCSGVHTELLNTVEQYGRFVTTDRARSSLLDTTEHPRGEQSRQLRVERQ